MFKFLSSIISPSTRKLVFSQNHQCLCLSPKFISTHSQRDSFTVSYLIETCRFSPHRAEKVSKRLSLENRAKPDAVIDFFNNLGFSQTKVLGIIRCVPEVLRTDSNQHLQPKIDFLRSKGFSESEVRNTISGYPNILRRSLEREIIPSFDFFSNLFHCQHKFMKTVARYSGVLCDLVKYSALNLQTLRERGVPESLIIRFVEYYPRTLKSPPVRFKEVVHEVMELGFDPLRLQFVRAVHIKTCLSRSTWAKKEGIYRKWGWSDDNILGAFRVDPFFMSNSECKIEAIMDLLVNKLGFGASDLARYPVVLSMSLGKRIAPRASVVHVLKSKGLVNQLSVGAIFKYDEKLFLDRFVHCHRKDADELLKLYKGNLVLAV